MYRFCLLVVVVIATVSAAPASPPAPPAPVAPTPPASIGNVKVKSVEVVPILESEAVKNDDGSYRYMFLGGDGSFREEQAVVQNAGSKDALISVSGSYKYIDVNGQEVVVHYTADENGFVPIGTNIPEEISAAAKAAASLPTNVEEPKRTLVKQSEVKGEKLKV